VHEVFDVLPASLIIDILQERRTSVTIFFATCYAGAGVIVPISLLTHSLSGEMLSWMPMRHLKGSPSDSASCAVALMST